MRESYPIPTGSGKTRSNFEKIKENMVKPERNQENPKKSKRVLKNLKEIGRIQPNFWRNIENSVEYGEGRRESGGI